MTSEEYERRIADLENKPPDAVEQLRGVGEWIARNADELVGDMAHNYIAEDGLRFTIQMAYDALPTVTAHKTFIVLAERRANDD